ncbi:hypothetical protein BGW38_010926 [Lunasporangiospora selenospora]|uniref:Peptidase S8/S53 domain-containing protein n=1 Tax=Lunasporangiospora selenospora TaxID=979761 RepID=A0A9P6KF71_9FUNG|nr:hypothetical protein BGW38_010926 [Lunasporangiospora selenospora]
MLLPSGNTQQLDAIEGIPGFPMASLPFEAGASILATFSQNPATTVVWSPSLMPFALGESGIPSSFSSLGLDGDLGSKPDLAAPGGSILSTYPLARGGYKVVSGTSMATPYIAGSYALYLQAKGRKPTPSVIRTVFKNTAQIWKNATTGVYGSAAKQGAGLINTLNAVMTSSSITPDHIDLLDTVHFRGSIELTINNMGKQAETYTLSHFPAEALNSYPTIKKFPLATPLSEKADAVAQFNPASVVVAAGQSAKVTVTFQEPAQGNPANFILYSGYVVATPATQGSSPAHVPYTGIKGDISQVPIMDTDNGFPALARLQGNGKGLLIPPTTVYNFDLRRELPIVLTRPGSHTPDAQIRVHDMATKQFVGYLVDKDSTGAFGEQGRIQNLDAGGNLATHPWIWRGYVVTEKSETATPTRLGPGMYTIVVASQRKLTKGQYPQDYEVFEVGSIGLSS